jgi:hypothetical protein
MGKNHRTRGLFCGALLLLAAIGARFDNRKGALPPGAYREADLDYHCGHRTALRLVYDGVGHQWATLDPYRSFRAVPRVAARLQSVVTESR